jgi:hypothetical protein
MHNTASSYCRAAMIAMAFATMFVAHCPNRIVAQEQGDRPRDGNQASLGLNVNKPESFGGYTLVFPLRSTRTHLIDIEGRVVRTWESKYQSGQDAYLLENGHLLRSAHVTNDEALFAGASQGGRIQEFNWEGELVWDYKFHDENRIRHHAITPMPNGNIMMIVWERKTAEECIAAGVNPEAAGDGDILVDSLVEVKPRGADDAEIVWRRARTGSDGRSRPTAARHRVRGRRAESSRAAGTDSRLDARQRRFVQRQA